MMPSCVFPGVRQVTGRNFLFKTFVEQTNHSPNDYEKVASDTIVNHPPETE